MFETLFPFPYLFLGLMMTFKRKRVTEWFCAMGRATWPIKQTKNVKRTAFAIVLLMALDPCVATAAPDPRDFFAKGRDSDFASASDEVSKKFEELFSETHVTHVELLPKDPRLTKQVTFRVHFRAPPDPVEWWVDRRYWDKGDGTYR